MRINWLGFILLILLSTAKSAAVFAFDAQGHRGARGLLPENTLPAFARALSIGVDTLELDVVMTRDGVVVVTHNPHLAPETTRNQDGQWLHEQGPAIQTLSLAELKKYDVGGINPESRYAKRFPHQSAVEGVRIPTLVEVIDLLKRSGPNSVRLNIEIKLSPSDPSPSPHRAASAVLAVLRAEDFLDRAIIQSFNWQVLKEVHQLEQEMETSFLSVEQNWMDTVGRNQEGASPWTAGLDVNEHAGSLPQMIKAAGGDVWSSYYKEVTAESLAQAHAIGLRVSVWTVNEPQQMIDLIALGVDSIITDYPDRLINVLKELQMPLPKSWP
ncbi:MAG: glycerophosphodiester phosphodiesterase [Gammaproteobacteria bacterium]|nr:glycerophosphodiester phosphodiesterase [Gammaproteobacteria bacterium]